MAGNPWRAPRQHGPISRSVYSQGILEGMRLDILTGRLPLGQHLAERKLAEIYDVSRGPIRDAIHILEQEGLVETPRNGRTRVVGLERKDAEDLFNLRIQLESTALEQIEALPSADILRDLNETVDVFRSSGQPDRGIAELDIAFHEAIVSLAGNRPLMTAWQLFAGLFNAILYITISTTHDFTQIGDEHSRIFQCIERGEANKGVPILSKHLDRAKRELIGRLESFREQNADSDGLLGREDASEWRRTGARIRC